MAKTRKFGTFSGVFTPSILTILGVIMYLRLPWIVGQAGLYSTLIIIIIAHIISSTTGLSVASIATDKKVKTGGTYYMISRSLGLPIGGTLGLALFVGLSLSVSLYLIGFAESFLSYLELENNINTIRITGSIALILVTTITFISTSLAIKSQYFIMLAIVLSLVSIFFGKHEFAPAAPMLDSISNAAPFMVLFGIFFPAVTGFEAGVSMSGDLADPKKSLPIGTIMGIVIGFVAYIGLAFFFSYTVSSDVLVNDPKVLFKISWVPQLVIAGIWGATLSSALGSILGAPRILQATAIDKITPRIFAKGVGASNEPRNALLLTFVIAETGILIGELDVIARIVSMFFITTYGFLNLSCTIESWASSDFRPEFKIPRLVSIIGFLACFIVMIQLDFVALIGATVILGLVFLYLKRKELTLDTGDTWGSVWSSLVRTGLGKLGNSQQSTRNWRPNIILFSGGSSRPYLLDLGKALVGKLGILSNFELIEDPSSKSVIRKGEAPEAPLKELQEEGIFTRKHTCKNLYDGIDIIATTYGFSGIEPNTILMGWGRNTKDTERYAQLLKKFYELNYNSVFLSFDKEQGFGSRKKIDIWWNAEDNNLPFALALSRFISSSNEWRTATIRILVITEFSTLSGKIHNSLNQVLDNYRISAAVKVINNAIDKRPVKDIIKAESQEADLIFLGISENIYRQPETYTQRINELTDSLRGSILLIDASSFFETPFVGIDRKITKQEETEQVVSDLPQLVLPKNGVAARQVEKIDADLLNLINESYGYTLGAVLAHNQAFFENLSYLVKHNLTNLKKQTAGMDAYRRNRSILRAHNDLLFQSRRLLKEFTQQVLTNEKEILAAGIRKFETKLKGYLNNIPKTITLFYPEENFKVKKGDAFGLQWFKLRKRFVAYLQREDVALQVEFRALAGYHIGSRRYLALKQMLERFGLNSTRTLTRLKELLLVINESYEKIKQEATQSGFTEESIEAEKIKITDKLTELQNLETRSFNDYKTRTQERFRRDIQNMSDELNRITVNRQIRKKRKIQKLDKRVLAYNAEFPQIWYNNLIHFANTIYLDMVVLSLQNRIKVNTQKANAEILSTIDYFLIDDIDELVNNVEHHLANGQHEGTFRPDFDGKEDLTLTPIFESAYGDMREILDEFPETLDIVGESFSNAVDAGKFDEGEYLTVPLKRIAEYQIDVDFITPVHANLERLTAHLKTANITIRDQVSVTNFNLDNTDSLYNVNDVKTYTRDTLQNLLTRLRQEREKTLNQLQQLKEELFKSLNRAFEPLNSYAIIRSSGELSSNLRDREGKKAISRIKMLKDRINKNVESQFIRLLYTKSEGVLLANKIQAAENLQTAQAFHILNLVESISPKPEILERLPFYYSNLFIGKSSIGDDFWVNREKEITRADKSIKRYKSGYLGGILVIGERKAGKTALTHKIAHEHYKKERIYTLNASRAGSADLAVFTEAVKKITGQRTDNLDRIFNTLPSDSVFVINDLELWWERSKEGYRVINTITQLISQHSHQCLFVVNCNSYAYHFINNLQKIEDHFIAVIECEPFDAEALKDVIMLRHRSSGLRLVNKSSEEEITTWKLASLFNKYFDYARGNVGVAMEAWINHIRGMPDSNTISIVSPSMPDREILDSLDEDWIVYIVQFMLHRAFTFDKLVRVMRIPEAEVTRFLHSLMRAGIVQENLKDVYQLNPYIEPHLALKFRELEIL